jgi:hypothetical protein
MVPRASKQLIITFGHLFINFVYLFGAKYFPDIPGQDVHHVMTDVRGGCMRMKGERYIHVPAAPILKAASKHGFYFSTNPIHWAGSLGGGVGGGGSDRKVPYLIWFPNDLCLFFRDRIATTVAAFLHCGGCLAESSVYDPTGQCPKHEIKRERKRRTQNYLVKLVRELLQLYEPILVQKQELQCDAVHLRHRLHQHGERN